MKSLSVSRMQYLAEQESLSFTLIFCIALSLRVLSLPEAFDSSDKVQHALAALNVLPLPWFTETMRHSKISAFLAYPYGSVLSIYYFWINILTFFHISINEFTLQLLPAIFGSATAGLVYLLMKKYVGALYGWCIGLAVALWHVTVFRSTSPFQIVLIMGSFFYVAAVFATLRYIEEPNKRAGLFLVSAWAMHLVSCQTAILAFPVWIVVLYRYKKNSGQFLRDGVAIGFFIFCTLLLVMYWVAYQETGNPYITVVGKMFSKGTGSGFQFKSAVEGYFLGIGYFISACIVFSLLMLTSKKYQNLLMQPLMLIFILSAVTYFVPLFFLSQSTVVGSYAFEAQFISFLLMFYVVAQLKPYRVFIFSSILLWCFLETTISLTNHWPMSNTLLGIEREFSLRPRLEAKAAGTLVRKFYSQNLVVMTDEEPLLANYYFGNHPIIAIYDSNKIEKRKLLEKVIAQKSATLAVVSPEVLETSGRAPSTEHVCIEHIIIDENKNPVKYILNLKKTNCRTHNHRRQNLSHEFNYRYNTSKQILNQWIPYPYPEKIPKVSL